MSRRRPKRNPNATYKDSWAQTSDSDTTIGLSHSLSIDLGDFNRVRSVDLIIKRADNMNSSRFPSIVENNEAEILKAKQKIRQSTLTDTNFIVTKHMPNQSSIRLTVSSNETTDGYVRKGTIYLVAPPPSLKSSEVRFN